MKNKFLLFFIPLVFAAGCDSTFLTKFYVSDFFSAEGDVLAKSTITTEYSDGEEAKTESFLKEHFSGAGNFRTTKEDYTSTMKFDYNVPVIKSSKISSYNNNQLFTFVYDKPSESTAKLGILMNKSKFDDLNASMSDEFYGSIDMSELKFVVELNNDLKKDVLLTAKSCYVDGKAVPFEKSYTLSGRSTAEITLSQVFKDALESEEMFYFLEIK